MAAQVTTFKRLMGLLKDDENHVIKFIDEYNRYIPYLVRCRVPKDKLESSNLYCYRTHNFVINDNVVSYENNSSVWKI